MGDSTTMTHTLPHAYFLLLELLVFKPCTVLQEATSETSPFIKNVIDKLCSILYTVCTTLVVKLSIHITHEWHFITILLVDSLFNC